LHDTSQLVQFGIGGGCQELSRARYPAQQAKQPADVEQARGNRSSDSQQERDRLDT
jgi:hypothetical protein